jgi:hypothetical protein
MGLSFGDLKDDKKTNRFTYDKKSLFTSIHEARDLQISFCEGRSPQ